MSSFWWSVDPRNNVNVMYSLENIDLLESAFIRGNATCELQLPSGKFTVDFSIMEQINANGGSRRVLHEQGVTWKCITECGSKPYDSTDTYNLEKAYREGGPGRVDVLARRGKYQVDIKKLRQYNISTGYERKISESASLNDSETFSDDDDDDDGDYGENEDDSGSEGSVEGPDQITAIWEFLDDDGRWQPYDSATCTLLEQAFSSASPGQVTVTIDQVDLDVDVVGMVQKARGTGPTIKVQGVRRLADFAWECLTDNGWTAYKPSKALLIERGLLSRLCAIVADDTSKTASDTIEFSMRGMEYQLDLAGMKQINKRTQVTRDVRRLGGCLWEWKDDDNEWKRYDEDMYTRLENALLSPGTPWLVKSSDDKYTVDIKQMKQTNNITRRVREVRRLGGFFWAWYNSGHWLFYDISDSAMIERAYQSKSSDPVMLRSGRYEVDAISLRQRNLKTQFLRDVKRVDINGTSTVGPAPLPMLEPRINSVVPVPSHWTLDSKGTPILRVPLDTTSTEYLEVQAEFAKTVTAATIISIERIQNMSLWTQYKTRKALMDERLPPSAGSGEKRLFHGTKADTVDKINAQGFNRNFAGQNATAYGKGVYFAVNASYSAHPTYSPPDTQGEKRMYVVHVAVGDYCVGTSSDVVPPKPRPGAGSPHDICDSTTNDEKSPTMFVTYHDAQQYPEYLITFKM